MADTHGSWSGGFRDRTWEAHSNQRRLGCLRSRRRCQVLVNQILEMMFVQNDMITSLRFLCDSPADMYLCSQPNDGYPDIGLHQGCNSVLNVRRITGSQTCKDNEDFLGSVFGQVLECRESSLQGIL